MARTVTARGTALLAGAVLALSACGGGSSSGSSGSGAKVTLNLVAYSTPQAAYTAEIAAFQKTAAGKNVTFKTSYGASGDQSRAVASGQAADIVAFSLQPRHRPAGQGQAGRRELGRQPVQGHDHRLGRGHHHPQGQPQGHHDLGRPGQARHQGADAQPVLLRQRALEHPRRLRRRAQGGQDRGAGDGLPLLAVQERAGRRRPAAGPRSPRSPAARATPSSRTRTRRSSPSRTSRPSTTRCPTARS